MTVKQVSRSNGYSRWRRGIVTRSALSRFDPQGEARSLNGNMNTARIAGLMIGGKSIRCLVGVFAE